MRPTPIPAERLERAKWLLVAAGPMGMLFWTLTNFGYVSLFARELGASNRTIGLLSTLPILCYIVPMLTSFLVERIGSRKKAWLAFAIPHRAVWLLAAAIPLVFGADHAAGLTALVAVVLLGNVFYCAQLPPWYGWIGDLIDENERGQFFGRRTMAVYAATIVSLPLFGLLLDAFPEEQSLYGFSVLYLVGVTIGVSSIVTHLFVPEPICERPSGRSTWSMLREALADRPFVTYSLSVAIRMMGGMLMAPFIALYYRHDLGMSYTMLSGLGAITYVGSMVGAPYLGMLSDRFGQKPVYVFGCMSLPLMPLAFFVATPTNYLLILPVVAMVNGLATAALMIGSNGMLLALSPPEKRPAYVFTHNAIYGMLVWPFPLLGGVLADWMRTPMQAAAVIRPGFSFPPSLSPLPALHPSVYHNVFFIGVAAMAAAIPIALLIRGGSHRGVGFVLRNMVITNPVRLFANVNLVGLGRSRTTKLRAMRGLGSQGSPLAVRDLIGQLDDPSLLVREEAVRTLGQIGDRAAVEPLLAKLRDPESFLQLDSARALGQIGDERAIDTLVSCLNNGRRELRQAAARALGLIGSSRACAALAAVCRSSDDPHLMATAVEALARIGRMQSLWDVLPLVRRASNPVFKKQLVLAIGQLLGDRDGFYKVLSQELRVRNSQLGRLTRRVGRNVRALGPEAATRIGARLGQFQTAYEDEQWPRAVDALAHIIVGIGHAEFHYDGVSMDELVDVMLLRDAKFALGCWFIELTRDRADRGESVGFEEALLGLYFLSIHRPSPVRR